MPRTSNAPRPARSIRRRPVPTRKIMCRWPRTLRAGCRTWRTILPPFSASNCWLRRKVSGCVCRMRPVLRLRRLLQCCASRCRRSVSIATWPTISRRQRRWSRPAHCRPPRFLCSRTIRFQYLPRKVICHEPPTGQRPHDPIAARARDQRQELANGSAAPNADEQSRSGRCRTAERTCRLWRNWSGSPRLGQLRSDRCLATQARRRPDAGSPVWQAGRNFPHPSRCAARADRELKSGAALGDARSLQCTRPARADDVWADDGGIVDLHRQPGHRAGDVRNICRGGATSLRRQPRGQVDPDGGSRRYGRRPTTCRDDGRCVDARDRMPAEPHRDAVAHGLPRSASKLDEALAIMAQAAQSKKPISVGLLGNAADIFPELVARGVRPDIVTDQTSAHDPINGYLPKGWTLAEWEARREADPKAVEAAAKTSMVGHVQAMLDFHAQGIPTLDYGNNIRQMAKDMGLKNAFDFPGFVPAYIRPLFCRGVGPFRWAALSGDPEDIFRTDAKVKQLMPDDKHLHNWLDMAKARIKFQGLPARICWVGLGDRHRLGLAFNEMVASGELKAPIVIGRDHLDSGSVASPNRETEAMRDGSDAVSDWPLLNALLNCASGATWVSLHHGGGVGIGYSQHAGMVIVADGTPEAARRIERVLWNDPASGVMRHADAGYESAVACAREQKLKLPMV